MLTTSSIFLKALSDVGITHIFANWGSDHPAILEDLQRQRAEGNGKTLLEIITCPNEMVALSAAQGFTQATGKPAAVIVHVDVGTQALAGAVHNVDRGRAPVLIYAGASPFSSGGEMRGSQNEWILPIQDVPDQPSIVRQYMRYTAQIPHAKVTAHFVNRAIQIATSHPKGPVYLWARRETMEEEVDESLFNKTISRPKWPAIEPAALSSTAANTIASALLQAKAPLIIASHTGRDLATVPLLSRLSTMLSIPVVASCASAVTIPFSHPFFLGTTYLNGRTHTPRLADADVILVLDSDVPWIPAVQGPSPHARIFVLDSGDPLKTVSSMGQWHVDAEMLCNADAALGLQGILSALEANKNLLQTDLVEQRKAELTAAHAQWVSSLDSAESTWGPIATLPNYLGILRNTILQRGVDWDKTLIVNEGITNYPIVWNHMRTEAPGMHFTSGGSSLGWGIAAAIGASLGGRHKYELIVNIVGDGSFLFGVPGSAYWIAQRYETPFLTIIMNNGGWKAPKMSMLGCHPTGHGSLAASAAELSTGFGPNVPDYAQIAVAASAGWAWGRRIGVPRTENLQSELMDAMAEALRVVLEEKRCAVLDCVLESI
ncbi:hypothetical protein HMN09_00688300 [Mycena chlorophos]|uniref:Thiamine diphosphate-binding protein n=1 Tax=Mycena chlorophos TaxID=658473 RepID=A0A8H6T193_MYCCL|nr:hypothetical protein HMN09_00688300 [Mycena chlorophos]